MADLSDRAVVVVGRDFNEVGNATGSVALVARLFILGGPIIQLPGSLLYRTFDVILGEVDTLGIVDRQCQPRIASGITAPFPGCDGYLPDMPGKDFCSLVILFSFFMVNVRPCLLSSLPRYI